MANAMGPKFCKFKTTLKKVKQAGSARMDAPDPLFPTAFVFPIILRQKVMGF